MWLPKIAASRRRADRCLRAFNSMITRSSRIDLSVSRPSVHAAARNHVDHENPRKDLSMRIPDLRTETNNGSSFFPDWFSHNCRPATTAAKPPQLEVCMLTDIPTAMRHIVRATLKTMRLRPDAYEQVEHQACAEIARRFPEIGKCMTIIASLPFLREHSVEYFCARNVPYCEAEDLSDELVATILKELFGRWPRGNVGAWFSVIRAHMFADYCEDRELERARFGTRQDSSCLLTYADPAETRAELERFIIDDLPERERAIFFGCGKDKNGTKSAKRWGSLRPRPKRRFTELNGPVDFLVRGLEDAARVNHPEFGYRGVPAVRTRSQVEMD